MAALSLATVIEQCQQQQTISASSRQWQVLHHLTACRTAAMGASQYHCAGCDQHWLWYHSCRDRHCPQCQQQASAQWCQRQQQQLLPVPYFHLVFTLPHQLNSWIARHDAVLYRLLFQCSWNTLNGMVQRRLQGQPGMTAVLHTWGQQLTRHVHLHCLVPAGVIRASGRWQGRNKDYLLPVRALSSRFRGLMVSALRQVARHGLLAGISSSEVNRVLTALMSLSWVVYARPALNHRPALVRYLARYSHRIGLSNGRLTGMKDGRIGLRWLDYRHDRKRKQLWLAPEELVRRFLLHVLPRGFMRIRHYGFLPMPSDDDSCERSSLSYRHRSLKGSLRLWLARWQTVVRRCVVPTVVKGPSSGAEIRW